MNPKLFLPSIFLFTVLLNLKALPKESRIIDKPAIGKNLTPIEEGLNPDGTINKHSGIAGSFDVNSYQMACGKNGKPVFLPKAFGDFVSDDDNWSDEFPGPPGTIDKIKAIAIDDSGNLYLGGIFPNFITKWNGTAWCALGTGMNGNVNTIAIDKNGNIYAGGSFTIAGGFSANRIAKWDGTVWSALGEGMDNEVEALAIDNSGNVYAGGQFSTAGGITSNRIAKWDGTTWEALGTGIDDDISGIRSVAIDSIGNIYVGGLFSSVSGVSANNIARWNGTSWSALGSGVKSAINTIAIDRNQNIYAGGFFTKAGEISVNRIAKWDGTVWSAVGSGMNDIVYSIAIDSNGYVYAGGGFSIAGDLTAKNIAKWNGTNWSALDVGVDNKVSAIVIDKNENIYTGGDFKKAGEIIASHIAKWNGTDWSAIVTGVNGINGTISSLAIDNNGNVYAGGWFSAAGEIPANRLAKWNGNDWSALGSGTDYGIWSIATDNSGNLYAGGFFTTAGNIIVNKIAKWDGTSWSALGTGMNDDVFAIVTDNDGNVYAGGRFTTAGEIPANHIAKWDGTSWSDLGAGLNGIITAIDIDKNGNIYAGGYFTTAGGVPANCIAKWDGTAWSALGIGMNSDVYAIVTDNEGNVYAGGSFTTVNGIPANHIAKWDGNGWSVPGAGIDNNIYTLAVDDSGNVYAGGIFTSIDGISANYIARWDKTSWSTLGSGMNNSVNTIKIYKNLVYCGGDFTSAGNKNSAYFAKYTNPVLSTVTTQIITDNAGTTVTGNATITDLGYPTPTQHGFCWNTTGNPTIDDYKTTLGPVTSSGTYTSTITGLTECQTYYMRAYATNTEGTGYGNEVSFLTSDVTAPITPTLEPLTDECSLTVSEPMTTDNCTGTVPGTTDDPLTYTEQGTYIIMWTFEDGNGNSASAQQTVIIDDNTVPTISCLENQVINLSEGQTSYIVQGTEFDPLTTGDNCKVENIVNDFNNLSSLAGSEIFPGTKTITWTALDIEGNKKDCSFDLTINQFIHIPELPTVTTQMITGNAGTTVTGNGTITDLGYPTPTQHGFCWNTTGNPTIDDYKTALGPATSSGTYNSTITGLTECQTYYIRAYATNTEGTGYGNEVSFLTSDVTAPITPSLEPLTDECSLTVSAPMTTDNCTGTVSGTTADPLTYTEPGTYAVTWTFEDENGNSTSAQQTVIIDDNTVPTISCLENQVINLSEVQTSYIVQGTEFDPLTTGDNCEVESIVNDFNNLSSLAGSEISPGTTTITWTATDISGNKKDCSFDLTVNQFTVIPDFTEMDRMVYPNPTDGIVHFDLSKKEIQKIKITNITGITILEKTDILQNELLDFSKYSNGIYFITIQAENEIITTKVIKK